MKALTVEATRALTKIANLQIADISQTKIAEIMQVSEAAISQIVSSADYKVLYSEKLAELHEHARALDSGWDTIEQFAIETVADTLKWGKDPNFALRAAAVANKAARRGNMGNVNNPLPAQMGHRVVVNLSQIFINKIQNLTDEKSIPNLQRIDNEDTASNERTPQKLTDSLSARSVRTLFGDGKQTEDEQINDAIDGLFENIPLLVSNG